MKKISKRNMLYYNDASLMGIFCDTYMCIYVKSRSRKKKGASFWSASIL